MTSLTEKYIPWYPVSHLKTGTFYIKYFSHTFEGLIINLKKYKSEKDIRLCITFAARDAICRIMNETYRAKLAISAEPVDSCGPLYKSENSDYMKSLEEESGDIMKLLDFKHYLIDDSEWTFDIASQCQPRVELFIDGKLVERSELKSHFNLNRGK